jgi:hypothetical protein
MSEITREEGTQMPGPASQRRTDIRSEVKDYIDRLVELYDSTNPGRGPVSEEGKLESNHSA